LPGGAASSRTAGAIPVTVIGRAWRGAQVGERFCDLLCDAGQALYIEPRSIGSTLQTLTGFRCGGVPITKLDGRVCAADRALTML